MSIKYLGGGKKNGTSVILDKQMCSVRQALLNSSREQIPQINPFLFICFLTCAFSNTTLSSINNLRCAVTSLIPTFSMLRVCQVNKMLVLICCYRSYSICILNRLHYSTPFCWLSSVTRGFSCSSVLFPFGRIKVP